jgi:hypothetical protein
MNKTHVGSLLVLSILLGLFVPINLLKADTAQSNESVVDLYQQIPLSNSKINAMWPNLPSAEALMNTPACYVINTDEIGKIDNSSELIYNPTGKMLPFTIKNYTANDPNTFTGRIEYNQPHIWLQYNATTWVQVSPSILKQLNSPVISSDSESGSMQMTPLTWPSSWALGVYANPTDISGSYPVTAAFSYGQFGLYSPSDASKYFYSDILTINNGLNSYQIGMCYDLNHNKNIVVQAYDANNNTVIAPTYWTVSANYNQSYSQFIKCDNQRWQFYWNQQSFGSGNNDGQYTLITGNQPTACAESNDFTESDFSSCLYSIGGMYNSTFYLAAIGYYFNGNWRPQTTSNPIPSGYIYASTYNTNTVFWVGTSQPPSWFGIANIAENEQIYLGYNQALTYTSHDVQKW